MNSEKLKQYVSVTVNDVSSYLGGIEKVREMHRSMNMVQFISGWLCGLVVTVPGLTMLWREGERSAVALTQEEIRRITDYVRLVIDTGSTGS